MFLHHGAITSYYMYQRLLIFPLHLLEYSIIIRVLLELEFR